MKEKDKKTQKKILKLILNIKKCQISDLQLFTSLVLIRFMNYDQTKEGIILKDFRDGTTFHQCEDLARELNSDDNIHYLLS